MKILIATPAYGDQVYAGFTESVSNLLIAFGRAFPDIVFEHRLVDLPVLATARNILASLVLNDPSFSHLLFIDADMAFSPMLLAKMLAFDKPFVGSIYPFKRISFERFATYVKQGMSTLQARMAAAEYVCGGEMREYRTKDGKPATLVQDGFVQARASGTGVMLIRREVLERMRAEIADLWLDEPGDQVRAWGLTEGGLFRGFDTMVNPSGYHVSEDIAFCNRWLGIGGEIWVAVDEAIGHIGTSFYRGQVLIALSKQTDIRIRRSKLRAEGRGEPWYTRALRRKARKNLAG